MLKKKRKTNRCEEKSQPTRHLGLEDLKPARINPLDGLRVNAQPANQLGPNLTLAAPFISLGGIVCRVLGVRTRAAYSEFALRCAAQEPQFGLPQLAEPRTCEGFKVAGWILDRFGHGGHFRLRLIPQE